MGTGKRRGRPVRTTMERIMANVVEVEPKEPHVSGVKCLVWKGYMDRFTVPIVAASNGERRYKNRAVRRELLDAEGAALRPCDVVVMTCDTLGCVRTAHMAVMSKGESRRYALLHGRDKTGVTRVDAVKIDELKEFFARRAAAKKAMEGLRLSDLSKRFGISRQRAYQLETAWSREYGDDDDG